MEQSFDGETLGLAWVEQGCLLYTSLEQFLPRRIEEIAVGIARAMRADADVEYNLGYSPVINDEEITQFLEESARTIVGQEKVVDIQEPTMGAEDMSYYLEKVPGLSLIHIYSLLC